MPRELMYIFGPLCSLF